MTDEALLTIEQLALALKVPEKMVQAWWQQGILPQAINDPEQPPRYRRTEVVQALRREPEIMARIRTAMRQTNRKC
jgi:hypothetical protein